MPWEHARRHHNHRASKPPLRESATPKEPKRGFHVGPPEPPAIHSDGQTDFTMTQLKPPSHCPMCGQSNACQMAAGTATGMAAGMATGSAAGSDALCWCMTADWLGAPGQLSQALPAGLPGDQCVCAACAQRLLQANTGVPSVT